MGTVGDTFAIQRSIVYTDRTFVVEWSKLNMRKSLDLNGLSLSQLTKLQAELPIAISRKTQERVETFKAKLARMAQDEGFDPYKLFGSAPVQSARAEASAQGKTVHPAASKTVSKIAVKYRDTKGNTWTGRGREPRWLAAMTKAGRNRSEFAVA